MRSLVALAVLALLCTDTHAAVPFGAAGAVPRATRGASQDSVAGRYTRDGWELATAPYTLRFPRDHGSHPSYRTEWWYYTGHLQGAQRSFGYQLTFFRVGLDRARVASPSAWAPHTIYFAHFALTDEDRNAYRHDERIRRPALGLAGADTTREHVWIDDWSAEMLPDGVTHRLRARTAAFAIDLEATPAKPLVVHGAGGVSRKSADAGNASHYYSFTRLDTRGGVRVDAESLAVVGTSWMDHEFSSSQLANDQVGWDWFSIQLDDRRELMLYVLRLSDGTVEPLSSGTLIDAEGHARHLARDEFAIESTGHWESRASGANYPHGWRVRVAQEAIDLTITPTVADQELRANTGGGVIYWEGSSRVAGTSRGRPVTGKAYVELTGYAGPAPGLR